MSSILKKIISILINGSCYYILSRFFFGGTLIRGVDFSYAYPFLAFMAVIRGSIEGGCSFALGIFLTQIGTGGFDWLMILCAFVNLSCIGWMAGDLNVRNGFFEWDDALRFNYSQLSINFFCWGVLYPALSHAIYKADLAQVVQAGINIAAGYSLSCVAAATLFLALYSRSRISEANFYRN